MKKAIIIVIGLALLSSLAFAGKNITLKGSDTLLILGQKNAAHVFADRADGNELYPRKNRYSHDQRRPSGRQGRIQYALHQCHDSKSESKERHYKAHNDRDPERDNGKIRKHAQPQRNQFLESVIQLKQSVPFRRHKRKLPHRKDLKQFKWYAGRFPQKAAARIYEVLSAVESNGEYKGLDIEACRIIHAASHRGRIIKRYIDRARGRSTAKFKYLTHVELVIYEFPS